MKNRLSTVGPLEGKEEEELAHKLVSDIQSWNHSYFIGNKPSVSDKVYDIHKRRLDEIVTRNPSLIEKVNYWSIYDIWKWDGKEVKHEKKMLSLRALYVFRDIVSILERKEKQANCVCKNKDGYVIEPKIDGISLAVKYMNGKFANLSTRGDGYVGENVTSKLYLIKRLPLKIPIDKGLVEVRGELFIKKSDSMIIRKLGSSYLGNKSINLRSIVSGIMRRKGNEIKEKGIVNFVAYDMVGKEVNFFYSQVNLLNKLAKMGFDIPIYSAVGKEEMLLKKNEFTQMVKKLDYETDGLVIKFNSFKIRERLKDSSNHPNWAFAYKFAGSYAYSYVIDIEQEVGRTGKINYVGRIKGVDIANSFVEKVNFHNRFFILEKDIRIGDYVEIEKAGSVIPKLKRIVCEQRHPLIRQWVAPDHCLKCGTVLLNKGKNDYCVNLQCPEMKLRRLDYFCRRMKLRSVGEGLIKKLVEKGVVSEVDDFYWITRNLDTYRNLILNIEGVGEKKYENMIGEINKSKKASVWHFLISLGIKGVGEGNIERIKSAFSEKSIFYWKDLKEALKSNLTEKKMSFGMLSIIQQIKTFWMDVEMRKLRAALRLNGVECFEE